ncbi:MAG: hypothetical protein GWM98_07590 [Nitrospinaceae bacterium]|nr:hypothetical protein [Nitrospinaceae bacterium]NIR54388.1 hypothetical protein [Nitrospinaceae bacterium]NIS84801.1 hypothetical protein [Nitrospinaceae bacterium]NIT81607.1 hypothetical protein [Nitrospinaceae bacterium]NIU43889.1 hypothetical protein [Nitrospinaceae bacterium]
MDFKKYNLILLIPLGAVFLTLYILALTLEPIDGDLTRTGPYPESEFGWNLPQDKFEKDLYTIAESNTYDRYFDVAIVGDSYSTMEFTYQWQNYLTQLTGWSSITYNIHRTNIDQLIAGEGFQKHPPKLFIWEFVERSISLAPHYNASHCQPSTSRPPAPVANGPVPAAVTPLERDRTISFFNPNFNESSYFLKYFLRGLFVDPLGKHARVIRLPLKTQGLFSSKNDREILLYNRDFWKVQRFREEFVGRRQCYIAHLQNQVQQNGKTFFIALAVPDKTTAYEDHIEFQDIKNINLLKLLDTDPRLQILNLDHAFKAKIKEGVKDLYPPNETHWGSRGHRLVTETLIQYLEKWRDKKLPPLGG